MNEIRPDNHLISRFREGDRDAFWEICQFYNNRILAFARKIMKNDADAEDIVSETFLKLWRHRQRHEVLRNVKAFLVVTTRNACIDEMRSRKRHRAAHKEIRHLSQEAEMPGDQEGMRADVINEIRLLLETLSPKRREVMRLIFFMGKKTAEVAEQLGISNATVLVHKSDAIRQLRDILRKKNLLWPD
jgi:RNA polymerase sigma-70 factor (family 1)